MTQGLGIKVGDVIEFKKFFLNEGFKVVQTKVVAITPTTIKLETGDVLHLLKMPSQNRSATTN